MDIQSSIVNRRSSIVDRQWEWYPEDAVIATVACLQKFSAKRRQAEV
jgi:hypothetical protein